MNKWSKVAGGLIMCCLVSDIQAAEAENAFVKVSADSPVYRLEQKGEKDFNAYCGGVAPATFSVAAQQPDWVLVRPSSGSLAIAPGTSGVWKVKSQLGEDKPDGRIYLWNYHIKAEEYNAKDITVPFGKTVKYISYEGENTVNSDWNVTGYGEDGLKYNTDSIIFSRSFWDITEWFTESYSTPQPGVYEIKANLTGKPSVNDSGVMTVVGAEFTENENHNYGFDDYSNWSLGPTDYYGERKGHCTLPYASVRAGDQGMAYLTVDPTSNTKEIEISSSASENDLALNPETATATTDFGFTPASSWFPQTATVTAKMDDTPLAKMEVMSYDQRQYKCILVPVSSDGIRGPNVHPSCFLINNVYNQTALEFTSEVIKFLYESFPSNGIWNRMTRDALTTSFLDHHTSLKNKGFFFVFMIEGTDSEGDNIQGRGVLNDHVTFIYSERASFLQFLSSHELGHNFGLLNLFERNPFISGPDKSNLMNSPGDNKLRKSQWLTIRSHHHAD